MSITKDFNNPLWYSTVDGDGTSLVGDGGKSIICSASAGSRSYVRQYITARPGEKLTLKVWARNNPAAGKAGYAALFVDSPINSLVNKAEITSDEPRLYTIHFEVPQQYTEPTTVALGVGSYGSLDGSAEFWSPEFYREGSSVVMQGTLKFPSGGGIEVVSDFINSGIGTISWRAAEIGYRIQPSEVFQFDESPAVNQYRPLLTVTGGIEGNTVEPYVWYGSKVNNVGWCIIQAVSLSTNAPVNLSTSTNGDRYATFKLEMVK